MKSKICFKIDATEYVDEDDIRFNRATFKYVVDVEDLIDELDISLDDLLNNILSKKLGNISDSEKFKRSLCCLLDIGYEQHSKNEIVDLVINKL